MRYENNWASLNSRPVPQWFTDAKFGIFMHWGLYSVPAYTRNGDYAEWYFKQLEDKPEVMEFHKRVYGSGFKYADFVHGFTAELFEADKFASLLQRSGARYFNLVSKHHDGFCLYQTDYAWNWNSVDVGPHRDFCREIKDALSDTDVKFGVYHSVYEWTNPLYLRSPERYALEHLIPMLKELVLKYEPWTLFTDGEWEHPSSVWHSTDFLTWLYNESPVAEFIVPNDRWGSETRGVCGGNFTTEYGEVGFGKQLSDSKRTFEECRGIGKSFGYNRNEHVEDYMTAKELLKTLCSLVSKGGNFLLNIGPQADGLVPLLMEERLLDMGKWLDINGEAIYASRPYTDISRDGLYYTQKDAAVYAIMEKYPWQELELDEIPYSPELKATLLGCDAPISVTEHAGHTRLVIPAIHPDDMHSEHLYTFKLEK